MHKAFRWRTCFLPSILSVQAPTFIVTGSFQKVYLAHSRTEQSWFKVFKGHETCLFPSGPISVFQRNHFNTAIIKLQKKEEQEC